MKERTKEWWVNRARREPNVEVAAGLVAHDPVHEPPLMEAGPPKDIANEETRIAFGRFVNLMRRKRGLSMEELADEASLDPKELLVIEDDIHYVPELRTVYILAHTFKVPQPALMQLAGLSVANDAELNREAVRFAARSESVQKLSHEENEALMAFIAVLSAHHSKVRSEDKKPK